MRRRVSLLHLMALIAVLALGLAAMKVASEAVATVVTLGSEIALLMAMLGAWVRRQRAAWVGFSLFGWGYIGILSIPMIVPNPDLDINYWTRFRIDGPMADFADWLHPELPFPPPPLDYTTDEATDKLIHWDRATQTRGGPLTPDELKSVEVYLTQVTASQTRSLAASSAFWIGMAFQGLTFALVGAFTGRLLDDQSRQAGTSTDAPTSNPAG